MKALKNRKDIHKFAKKYLIHKDPMTPLMWWRKASLERNALPWASKRTRERALARRIPKELTRIGKPWNR